MMKLVEHSHKSTPSLKSSCNAHALGSRQGINKITSKYHSFPFGLSTLLLSQNMT